MGDDLDYRCGILPKAMESSEWLAKHAGHRIEVRDERISIKLMRSRHCLDCKESHLFYMVGIDPKEKQPEGHGIDRFWRIDMSPCTCKWCGPLE